MIEAADRALMEESVRAALAGARGSAAVDAALAELGWLEMLAAEPSDAIEVVFRGLGAAGCAATALDDVLAAALGAEPRADLAVLLPRFRSWDAPGRRRGEALHAEGLATSRAAGAGDLLVVCADTSGAWALTLPVKRAEVGVLRGIDPEAGLHRVRVQAVPTAAAPLDPAAWRDAVALGRRALAYQIAGACRAMLELARSHALERVQFGRPIAHFQAVRHRLADAFVAVEALEATLGAAREAPGDLTAALAKALAGRTAHGVARHCQQVLAGIGFTTEHPFHRFLKRALALEGLLGSADEIVRDAGRRLLAERRVPTLIEL